MPNATTDKRELLARLRARVEADLETLIRRQRDTQAGATHAENRAEHAKDTRATEDSYLARGLADRVEDLTRLVDGLDQLALPPFEPDDAVAATALVTLRFEDGDADEAWWVVPGAGGFELEAAGVPIRTITPRAPLGRAMLGLTRGDAGALATPRGLRAFEILDVS